MKLMLVLIGVIVIVWGTVVLIVVFALVVCLFVVFGLV